MADGYKVLPNRNFSGGLNLRDKSDVVKESEAIDLLNVDFTDVGVIKQRDGYLEFTSSELTNRVDSFGVYYASGGTKHLLAGCGTRLEAINSSGGVVDSETGLTGGPYTFARFAAPTQELAFAANGSDTLRQYDGSTWTAPTATVDGVAAQPLPKGAAVCVTPNTSRLVNTAFGTGTTSGPDGTVSNPSRIYFSNIADPFTWETDGTAGRGRNRVDVTPGDGEQIMAAVPFRDKVFVFKQSKFFVFEGEGTNNDATPIFRYRAVDTGVGLAAKQAITVAREGIYFMGLNGIYYTNGNDPILLSDKIGPLFTGRPELYFQSGVINFAQLPLARLTWHDERLYLAVPTGSSTTNDLIIVYDTQQGWWSVYDVPASALVAWTRTDSQELHFGYATGTKDIGRFSITETDDNGVAITSRWRSGWYDFDIDTEKTIRQCRLWGAGAIFFKLSRDFRGSFQNIDEVIFSQSDDVWEDGTEPGDEWGDGTGADTWGGSNQPISRMNRSAIQGTVFSMGFSNNPNSAAWSLHRVARHIRESRPAGVFTV